MEKDAFSELTKDQIEYLDSAADKIEDEISINIDRLKDKATMEEKTISLGILKIYIIKYIRSDNFDKNIVNRSTATDYILVRIVGARPKGYRTYDKWHDDLLKEAKNAETKK